MPPEYEYFTPEEVVGLDPEFAAKLDKARHVAQTAFIITSGFRTPEKNQSIIGAVPDSAHLKGLAVDLRIENNHETWQIIKGLMSVDINRIGIYINSENVPIHIHCDADPEKVAEIIFIKQEASSNVHSA